MPHKVACMAIYIKYTPKGEAAAKPPPPLLGERPKAAPIFDVDSLVCYYFGVDSYGFLGF